MGIEVTPKCNTFAPTLTISTNATKSLVGTAKEDVNSQAKSATLVEEYIVSAYVSYRSQRCEPF